MDEEQRLRSYLCGEVFSTGWHPRRGGGTLCWTSPLVPPGKPGEVSLLISFGGRGSRTLEDSMLQPFVRC